MTIRRKRLLVCLTTVAAVAFSAVIVLAGVLSRQAVAAIIEPAHIESGLTEDGYPYLGSPDAPVTFVEFSDYSCGFCRSFTVETAPRIIEEFVAAGKVRYILHPFPRGEPQVPLVEAALCAADQGRFWDYHMELFENQDRFGASSSLNGLQAGLIRIAAGIELDIDLFVSCWDSHQYREAVLASVFFAIQGGIQNVPTFAIQDQLIYGDRPYVEFKRAIEKALAEAER